MNSLGLGKVFEASIQSVFFGGIFLVLLVGYGVITLILSYHWRNYLADHMVIRRMRLTYLVVSGALIVVMAASLISLFT